MSLFSSSSKQKSSSTTTPNNPSAVEGGLIDFTKLINSLGNQDPRQYVTGPSSLQNAAFSMGAGIANRYGAQVGSNSGGGSGYTPQPVGTPQRVDTGQGLFGQNNINPSGTADYAAYVTNNPDVQGWYNGLSEKDRRNISSVTGGDGTGYLSPEQAGQYFWEQWGKSNNAQYGSPTPFASSGGATGGAASGGINAAPGYGYEAATGGFNPVQGYQDAAGMTARVGNAGPNVVGNTALADGVEIDPVSKARATQGYKYADPYENRYIDNVVNTTLANYDENAGRLRAQEAAAAAGNNAFGGSRYGVQRAITEENLARERASQEANLRYSAQDRAFGFGMQDAGQANQVSIANAQAANARAQAQAQLEMTKQLANMQAENNMGQFNAGQADNWRNRQLASAGQLASIGTTAAANERADLTALAQLGTDERGISQQQATADLDLMKLMAQLYGTAPLGMLQGQTTNSTVKGTSDPSMASVLGSGLLAAGSLGWQPFGAAQKSAVGA